MAGRMVIEVNASMSEEAAELLRDELARELDLEVGIGPWTESRDLREAVDPVALVSLFLAGIQATPTVIRGIKKSVRAWRRKGQRRIPPRRLSRVRAWHYDEEGRLRLIYEEEREEEDL